MRSIKSHSKGSYLATILLFLMTTFIHSENSGKIVERALCPRYMIINEEIAMKMDSIYSLAASMESVCLQGYMYYPLSYPLCEPEAYNDNKLYYYVEVVKQYHSCEPPTAVVTNRKDFPFLIIEKEEIASGFFSFEGDSVWVDYYHSQEDIGMNGRCVICCEDADSVIARHKFSFLLPEDVDSAWLKRCFHCIRKYKVGAP